MTKTRISHPTRYKLMHRHVSVAQVKNRAARIWAAYKPLILLVIGALLVMAYIPCRIDAAHHRFSSAIGGEVFILLGGLAALIAACREVK